jgi:hypothetical protein
VALDRADVARREHPAHELAQAGVPGRVLVDHHQPRPLVDRADERAALVRRERLGVSLDRHDVVPLRQRPEARAVELDVVDPRHGMLTTEEVEVGMRRT